MNTIAAQIHQTVANLTTMANSEELVAEIARTADACIRALRTNHKILFAGNGGSAADSQHLAAELVNRFSYDRPGLPAFALSTDTSVLTAIGNDYGYEHLFARQIDALGQAGDVFIGISTSGQSSNILDALRAARCRGLVTVGLTGRGRGQMPELCDYCLQVPSDATPRIQEGHIVIGHIICERIEADLFPRP